MMFRLRADDGQTLNSGLMALRFLFGGSGSVLLRNPLALLFFQWGRGSPLDPRIENR